jgi:hypothetical protein
LIADPVSHRLLTDLSGAGAGSVTNFSFTNANGISGVVTNPTTTPNLTLTLGAITPTSVNGNTITTGTGTLTLNTFTLTVAGTASVSGTNTGDQTTISGNAGSATTVGITDDNTTNATMFPTWVTANTGNLPEKVSSTKLQFNPSTATLTTGILTASTDLTLIDSSAPAKVAGQLMIHSLAQNGGSRPEIIQNLGSTGLVITRDSLTIVRNSTGGTLTKGSAIYTSGNFLGIIPTGALARADSISTLVSIGIALDDIAPNAFGYIMNVGVISGVDMSAFANGDELYVSPTVAGGLTNVRPSGTTNFVQPVGEVFNNAVSGQFLVRSNGGLYNRETGTNAATFTASAIVGTTINATTGFQVAGAATSGNVLAGNGTNFVSTAPAVSLTNTATLTNKRVPPRIVSAASYTTNTGTSLDFSTSDEFVITAQAGALLFNNPSGSPSEGEKMIIRIKDNGTARALTYDTQYRPLGNALPTTTIINKTLYMGFIWNAVDTKMDLVAVSQEA